MFCPSCKAEYRPGFTVCADCRIELVEVLEDSLALTLRGPEETNHSEEDPFCEFWRGEDGRLKGELCDVLAEAGIPYRTLERTEFWLSAVRPLVYRIAVPFSLFEKAERTVAEAYREAEETTAVSHPVETGQRELPKRAELLWRESEVPEAAGGEPGGGEDSEKEARPRSESRGKRRVMTLGHRGESSQKE